ncbi:MAG: hypothetical protein ACRDPY_19130 [Streptosporangiaceae bacterium]
MLTEAFTAVAAAGGTAVVQAAGTDAWAGFRARVAKWFARGDSQQEHAVLERLDQAAAALEAAGPGEAQRARAVQEGSWQTRFELSLEGLEGKEQQRAAAELGDLLASFAGGPAAAVGQGAVAVAGDADIDIHGESGGVAAWQMGSVQIGQPPGGPGEPDGEPVDPHQPGRSRG